MGGPPDRWARVRKILEGAQELAPSERNRFLTEECNGDETLRSEIEALLAASEDTEFLSEPPVDITLQALEEIEKEGPLGARVGPFRLVEWLARGGMGSVFIGERADGAFDQKVAVKLLRNVLPAERVAKRFSRERSILASLNHPNIAHLLDGGMSDFGPYLAMEFVDGLPILDYCDQEQLGIAQRIELFATVCEAVHFAHQKLVVHRDLKPSNVFVTKEGRVKLLDFGIASLLEVEGLPAESLTRTGVHLMTPEYASPEQIRGEVVSTASDVYSLGMLLFELLTGQRPYDLRGLSPGAVERRIADGPVPRPSEAQSTGPEHLRRRLKGDLDTIVLKAMHRDPARRYGSAAELAADLRRHLAKRPVVARPDTFAYRFSAFIRRHPAGVAASVLVLLAVTVGSIATAYQAQRARDRFEGTRGLANSMLSELNDALGDLPGGTAVRALLVSQALSYLDELREDPQANSELLLEVADAYSQIGAIQGNPLFTNLGDLAAARTSYEMGLRLREQVWTQDTNDPDARQAVADSYGHLAVLTAAEGDLTESTRLAQLALDILNPSREVRANDDEFLKIFGRTRALVGRNLVFEGAFDEGLAELEEAVTLLEEIAPRRPNDLQLRLDLWEAYASQMDGWRFSGQFEPALAVLEDEACPMLNRLEARHPTRPAVLYGLHECYDYIGTLQQHLGLPEAEASYELGLAKAEALRELDPANERANLAVSISLLSIGRKMFLEGRRTEGQPMLEEALSIRLAMREQNPSNLSWIRSIASVQRELCRGLLNAEDSEGALGHCLDAVQTHEENIQRDRAGAIAEVTLAYALGHTGRVHRDLALRASDVAERDRLLRNAEGFFQRSVDAYERADLPDDSAWEIPPDEIRAEWAAVTQLLRGTGHMSPLRS